MSATQATVTSTQVAVREVTPKFNRPLETKTSFLLSLYITYSHSYYRFVIFIIKVIFTSVL